jgi:polysaccharide export outer membrane protein
MKTILHRTLSLLSTVLLAGLLWAPVPGRAPAARAPTPPAETKTAAPSTLRAHILAPSEKITVSIENVPECQLTVVIDEKGQVDLRFIGKTTVGGLTTDQAARVIEKAYIDGLYLRRPKASVFIESQVVRTVTVLGAVKNQGKIVIPTDQDVTVLDVILAAGGFTEIANENNVMVTRIMPDATRKIWENIDVEAMYKSKKDLKDALIIQPDDIINVKTRLF